MKTIGKILLLGIFLFILPVPLMAGDESSADSSGLAEKTMTEIDFSVLEEYKHNLDSELSDYLESKSVKEWLSDFQQGKWEFDIKEVSENVIKYFFKEITANSGLLGKLLILSVVAALINNLQTSFSSGIARISYLACFLALSAIAVTSFKVVLQIGQQAIDNMVTFMMGMLPQMLMLVAALGNINSAAILFPLLMTTAAAFANAVKNIVFPLIILSAILSIANQMSDTLKVERMAKFFGQMAQLSLGLFLTIFVGLITLRTLYASALDKVALRTTKFITDNTIPVVGKMFSDTIEVAAGYIVMIKQALGIFGVIIILGMLIFPLMKIAAIALIYKVTAAVAEPMGDTKTAVILETMGSHILLMLAAVASAGMMFFVMISIVVAMTSQFGLP
ncbi:MAG TPA: stage III sporulation protein AE [Syntrophomonadaceae bacterium]|nr:stage III sporulation protein AE [Syntrophomonadaceae bacterium]HPR92506.1 stage III sporulation protein AE [Syntrophomonadaceae bacterium]